jgi:hypothetical protein
MKFSPENYPGEYPDDWYNTYEGTMVTKVSLLEDMLVQSRSGPWSSYIPKIYFSFGSWIDDEWITGINGGCGIFLGFDESSDLPSIILGDFQEYEELLEDPEDSVVVQRLEVTTVPLDTVGMIIGAVVPPHMLNHE